MMGKQPTLFPGGVSNLHYNSYFPRYMLAYIIEKGKRAKRIHDWLRSE